MTKCWRCKGSIDTTKVDTVETVGLCQPCWDNSSAGLDAPRHPVDTMTEERAKEAAFAEMKTEAAERARKYRPSCISPEQFVHDPPWDDTDVRPKPPLEPPLPKVFMEANYASLEMRVVAQLDQEAFPQKYGVDFEELQKENDPTFFDRSPFHSTIGMARLEQELSEAIRNATQKFRNKNFDEVRDEVRRLSVDVLLKNTPNGFPTPPRELIEGLVDKCLDRQFGPKGSTQATNYRV